MNRLFWVICAEIAGLALFLALAFSGDAGFHEGARVFHIPLDTNPPTLDPVQITDTISDAVAKKIFNGLVRYDRDLQPVPDLAESWTWSDVDRSYTFKLRRGVRFHNGRELKAADVKYSWERLLDPALSRYMQILELVEGAQDKINSTGRVADTPGLQALDDYTFKVRLIQPSPTFLFLVGMLNAAVIPREAVEEAERAGSTFGRRPIGTGPFRFVAWHENTRLVLERNPDYFRGLVKLDGVVFKIVPSPRMRLEKFFRGEFDVSDIPYLELPRLESEHPDLLVRKPYLRTSYLAMTMNRPGPDGKSLPTQPLGANLKLRQAINCAINRAHVSGTILAGRSRPAWSILPPGMPGHDPELRAWHYDLERARRLLAEAGYPQGVGLRALTFLYKADPDVKKIVLAIHHDLTELGLNVELQGLDWAAYLDRIDKNPPDLFLLSWVADFNDPDNFLYFLFHTRQWGDNNHVRYSRREVDQLLDRGRATLDQAERIGLYRQAERLILDDCPWAILENRTNVLLLQPWVKGVRERLTAMDSGPGLNYVDFAEIEVKH